MNLARRTWLNVFARLFGSLSGALAGVFLARGLSVTDFGFLSSTFALVGVATLASDLGVSQTTTRLVSRHPTKSAEIGWIGALQRGGLALLLTGLSCLVVLSQPVPVRIASLVIAVSIIAAAGNVGQSLLLARLRPDLVARAGLVQSLIWTLGALFCWLLSAGPVAFAVFFLMSQVAQSCVVLALSRDLLKAPRRVLMRRLAKPIIASSITVGIGSLAWAAMQRLPIVFVTSTAGAQEGASLGVAGRILDVLFIFPTVAAATLLPVIANRAGGSTQGQVERRSLALMTALGAVLAFGASIGGGAAAVIMFGSDYVAAAATVAVYSLVVLPFAVDCYWGTQLIAANRGSVMAWTGVASAIISIALAILLTPTWGAVGGAFAVLLAQSLRALSLWLAASDLRQRATGRDQVASAILIVVAICAVALMAHVSSALAAMPLLGLLTAGISSAGFALVLFVLMQIRWREILAVFGRGA